MKKLYLISIARCKRHLWFAAQCAVVAVAVMQSQQAAAQADIHFSQFYETSILRNPALTGVFSDDYKVGVYGRSQWSSITNPYSTALITAETHFAVSEMSENFFSFGLLGYVDKAGSIDQKITTFYPAVNFNKSLNSAHNSFLSVGFTGGYVQYSFDPNKATFNNQYLNGKFNAANPTLENLPAAKMSLWDLGAGINYNTSTGPDNNVAFIAGVSAYHFTQPKFSYYQTSGITENMRLNANVTMNYVVNDNVSFQLHGNYAMQGTYQEIMMGGLANYTRNINMTTTLVATGGVFYRYGDAVIPVVKVRYNRLALGISYDVNTSSLKEASNLQGGTEVTLFITGDYTDKGITRKTVCPKY
jgi:type IX secretion system PorP/SprF family membrane protein